MRVVEQDSLPRRVQVLTGVWIPLADGRRLAARIWLPQDAADEPVPALLEYHPYRLGDATSVSDAANHGYLAGHGYASVRVDLAGSGDSDGILRDEYLAGEQQNAVEVIAWLAAQPWCTGRVGMFGVSWGGFNTLQVAALRPPALAAVVSVCASDDRYTTDVHYMGGCVIASEMLSWATTMLTFNAMPPDPETVGERWREMWLERVKQAPLLAETWLSHQRRDAYWKQGSVAEDPAALACPVLLVGGWADGYRDGALRLLARLGVPAKAIVGPWGHGYPHTTAPGPAIGFLQETLRWWDHWLKDLDTGAEAEPALRAWLQDSQPPARVQPERPGRWVAEARWPSPGIALRRYALGDGTLLDPAGPPGSRARRGMTLEHLGHQVPRSDPGPWGSGGTPNGFAGDQRQADEQALTFTSEPFEAQAEILGNAVARLELAADRTRALVALRLCDVRPDGTVALITRGVLNLSHRDGHEHPQPLHPGARYTVDVELRATGYVIPQGHRLRLAVASTDWPIAWPSPEPVTLSVLTGGESALWLPVRSSPVAPILPVAFAEPQAAPSAWCEPAGQASNMDRELRHDPVRDAATLTVPRGMPFPIRLAAGLVLGLTGQDSFDIVEGDPLSAAACSNRAVETTRGDWSVRVDVRAAMRATRTEFLLDCTLEAFEDGQPVADRVWSVSVPRDGV